MSGKSLNDLDLKEEVLPGGTMEDLPEFGGFSEPPQPGPYRFRTPADLSKQWDVYDGKKGQRVRLLFDRDAPLTILASPGNKANGDSFQTQLSNEERARGKDKSIEVSDLDYLLKAFKETTRPTTNKGYIQAVNPHAGQDFGADITFSFSCSDSRPIYVQKEDGTQEKVDSQMGCGKKYYMKDLTKVEGVYPTRIQCECGAALRCYANLDNLRA